MKQAEVEKIAGLARLSFEQEELAKFVPTFQQILDYFQQLGQVDVAEVDPTYHALFRQETSTPMREDRCEESLKVEDALREAPKRGEGHFRVPKVIE